MLRSKLATQALVERREVRVVTQRHWPRERWRDALGVRASIRCYRRAPRAPIRLNYDWETAAQRSNRTPNGADVGTAPKLKTTRSASEEVVGMRLSKQAQRR